MRATTLLLLLPTVRAGVLQLSGADNAIDFGDGANRLSCRPQTYDNPSVRSVHPSNPQTISENVTAELVGVSPTCAGLTIQAPCASDHAGDPALFFCAWTAQVGTEMHLGPFRATRTEDRLPGGAVLGVRTSLGCPFPTADELYGLLATGGAGIAEASLSLSVFHYATTGPTSLALPFAGVEGGDVVRFTLPPAPPTTPPPAVPPSPSPPGYPDCSTMTSDGEYQILKDDGSTFMAQCLTTLKGGGWMLAGVVTASGTSWQITDADNNQGDSSSAWESTNTVGDLGSLSADYKSEAWNAIVKSEIMVLYNDAFLFKATGCYASKTMRATFADLTFTAGGSANFGGSEPPSTHRCTIDDATATNDNALSRGCSPNTLLLKWGEREGVQDGNKDRAMFSTNCRTAVDAPSGLGSFAQIGSDSSVNVGIDNDNAVSANDGSVYKIYIK